MKVRELRNLLFEIEDQEAEVLISRDAEGNRMNVIYDVTESLYDDEEIYSPDEIDPDEIDDFRPVVVLWP